MCSSVSRKAHEPLNVATSNLPLLLRLIFLTSYVLTSRFMSNLTFEAKSDRKQWWFKLRQAKYRFLEAGLNMLIRCIRNITLRVGIGVYKPTGEETGKVEDLVSL